MICPTRAPIPDPPKNLSSPVVIMLYAQELSRYLQNEVFVAAPAARQATAFQDFMSHMEHFACLGQTLALLESCYQAVSPAFWHHRTLDGLPERPGAPSPKDTPEPDGWSLAGDIADLASYTAALLQMDQSDLAFDQISTLRRYISTGASFVRTLAWYHQGSMLVFEPGIPIIKRSSWRELLGQPTK